MTDLRTYGFSQLQQDAFSELALVDHVPARIVADFGGYLKVVTPNEYEAEVAGALLHEADTYLLPKVGDWVAVQIGEHNKATIRAVLPRHSEISRKAPGSVTAKQVLATNIDIAFVVQALDHDFSPNRLERYSYQLKQSDIEPVFVFNKQDKSKNLQEQISIVEDMNIPYILTTASEKKGIEAIEKYLKQGVTAVFIGSSGVGKSTLTNALVGDDKQKTAAVRTSDSTGRHTTSHRELFLLPTGGMIIDTPGIRELQLWGEEEFLAKSFEDIVTLARDCEFRNCSHTKEIHCAVLAAIESGDLSESRLENYLRFKQELSTTRLKVTSESIKLKKQRARRRRKAVELDEKSRDDGELY